MIVNKSICVLIVTHNHEDYIDELIKSLVKFNVQNVYFCDAKSSDNTLSILMESPFSQNVLAKTELVGFSKNNNDLIRHFKLKSDYFLLLNPDTYFDIDFIELLHNRIINDNTVGIVSPLLRYPNGDLQITWKSFPNIITVFKKRLGLLKAKQEVQMLGPEIDWCLGACMLISDKLLKKDGSLLDERYRLYCEDIDICFEAKIKKLKVIGLKEAYIYHHLNETSTLKFFGKYNFWNIESIIKFMIKWNVKYFQQKR